MKFRYDINALRVIAVIAVIGFHFKLRGLTGGFCGVDVFFVISGYLMSKIIIEGIDENKFSLLEFYVKRLKRIVPALLFLVLVCSLIGFFVYFPVDYRINERNATAALLFCSNILFWQTNAYFERNFIGNEFLHTWSLSIEWQFYLLYPIAIILLLKVIKNKASLLYFFIISTLLICALSIAYTPSHENASFYLLPTRCWEMMFGGIAFLIEGKLEHLKYKKLAPALGYTIILLSVWLLRRTNTWPGLFTLFPVSGAFLVIVSNTDFQLLRYKVVQFVGKISYSLYLWHWPIYIIGSYLLIPKSHLLNFILILILFIAAFISFKFVESFKFKNSRSLITIATILVVCTGLLSFIESNNRIFNINSVKVEDYWQGHKDEVDRQFDDNGCFLTFDGSTLKDLDKQFCLRLADNEKNILLIGDSHAMDISNALGQRLKEKNINLARATASGCLPYISPSGLSRCTELVNYIYKDFIITNKQKINGVILSAYWALDGADTDRLLRGIKSTVDYLSKNNIPVLIIGQNEIYTAPYPLIAAMSIEHSWCRKQYFADKFSNPVNNLLSRSLIGRYINIYKSINSNEVSASMVPYMFDEDHFTTYGSELITDKIMSDPITVNFFAKSFK